MSAANWRTVVYFCSNFVGTFLDNLNNKQLGTLLDLLYEQNIPSSRKANDVNSKLMKMVAELTSIWHHNLLLNEKRRH